MNSCTPQVEIDGRLVTVKFEMPFMADDTCITPRHGSITSVSRAPDVCVELSDNMQRASVRYGGAWYSSDHTQMHGVKEFLPDMDAFLAYWLAEPQEYFAPRFAWLVKMFADRPDALAALNERRVGLKRSEIEAAKAEMAAATLASAHKINALEIELAALAKSTIAQAAEGGEVKHG